MKTAGYIPKNGKPKDSEKPKPGAADGAKQDNGGKPKDGGTPGAPDGGANQNGGAR